MSNPKKLFPMIVTDKLEETKAFYRDRVGFEVVTEMEGYLQVRSGSDEADPEIAFIASGESPDGTVFRRFAGEGLVLSVPTASADEKAKALLAAGVEQVLEPADKPWGWRSFMVSDPNGVGLDFFHVLPAAAAAPGA